MLKAAIAHRGTVMLDVISPCVTFNDHEGSTKSYKFVKDHEEPLHDMSFVPAFEDIAVDYDAGTSVNVTMHDGSSLRLRKLEHEYDPTDKIEAIKRLMQAHEAEEVLTGVLLREHHRAQLHRHAEHDRPSAGDAAGERNASFARSAGAVHGRAALGSEPRCG